MRFFISISFVSMLVLALSACGDATEEKAEDNDSDSNGPIQLEPDQCQNEEDLDWLHSELEPGETGRDFARDKAGDCGLGCISHSQPDDCAIRCMKDQGVELTDGCAGCYGHIVLCTINDCLQQCIDDPQSDICYDCQEDKGCNDEFYACTGDLD